MAPVIGLLSSAMPLATSMARVKMAYSLSDSRPDSTSLSVCVTSTQIALVNAALSAKRITPRSGRHSQRIQPGALTAGSSR